MSGVESRIAGRRRPTGDFVFDSDLLPARDRTELSRQFLASSYRLEPVAAHDLTARAALVTLGAARVTQGFLSSASLTRKADEDAGQPEEQVSLFLTLGGGWGGRAGRRNKDVRAGQLVLLDRSQGLAGAIRDLSSITLVLPKRLLTTELPHLEDLHGETLNGPMAALLSDQMASVARHGARLDAAGRGGLERVVSALVMGALSRGPGEAADRAGFALTHVLLERARRFIRAHCCDPALSPESVAEAMGVSRASLYRAFAPEGGVGRCILQTRVQAARAALEDPAERRRIGEIGFAHGFASDAQFSRAMRAAYGLSPRELRWSAAEA